MTIARSVLDTIGNTPLIRLNRASEATGCEILGKAEFLNPGQSVKDRAALFIVRDAEAKGLLKPGGRIVEGTAGNTGIGLAMVGMALGYKATIVIPRTQSQEKKDAIRIFGAELVEVDAAPYSNPANYVRYSGRLAEELAAKEPAGAIWANQFDNVANRQAHIGNHGPGDLGSDRRQDRRLHLRGRVRRDAGGRRDRPARAEQGRRHRHRRPLWRGPLFLLAPPASSRPRARPSPKASARAGSPPISKGCRVDRAYRISDEEMLLAIYDLVEHEGLVMGGSTGVNVAGAIRLAKDLGPGHTIVTVLCDYGQRYQSKIYNPAFLQERGLPLPGWLL